jgi:predicted ester cyclase
MISDFYRAYIACLNRQDWSALGEFVHRDVVHNGRRFGLDGYQSMLEQDFADIPDLRFNIQMLIVEPPYISCRLIFDCSPKGNFQGLNVNGQRVKFAEHVIYEIRDERIAEVWSLIDKQAIEAQLATT